MTWQQRFDELELCNEYECHTRAKSFITELLKEVIDQVPNEVVVESIKLGDVTLQEYLKDKYGI